MWCIAGGVVVCIVLRVAECCIAVFGAVRVANM